MVALRCVRSRLGPTPYVRAGVWQREWDRARRSVSLPGLHLHDLRHVAGTLAAATGAGTKEIMRRLGHATQDPALRYQHATDERDRVLASGIDRLIRLAREEQTAPVVRLEMRRPGEPPARRPAYHERSSPRGGTVRCERITINPQQMGGLPCIRGLRISVATILGQLAAGQSHAQILEDFPELVEADIYAALELASEASARPGASPRRVRLLIDENLSWRVAAMSRDAGHDATHVAERGLAAVTERPACSPRCR